ncbi:LPXTG-motif cell wall anchor domain protein/predicted conserved protein [Golovinomyces cichoracearum]|uniref:LPXTG-motif cell wall anchor domain protein/predicted conserved protein n=1 Tax=Golovinomyces cichoracearum TaxID=62708 RepID=A0A420HID4_9PEZI|nr:LPXTG-motif cell wall anchor domain protein/predicted conserved protein [Golovinomyces cichoracearum]
MSELESRLSRISHKTPYRAVSGKESNTYEKATGHDALNSTNTRKTTDVAPITNPIQTPFPPSLRPRKLSTKSSSSSSPSPPSTAFETSQFEPYESHLLLPRHQQLRPYRRLARSSPSAPDTSSAKAVTNSQRTRRKAKNTKVPCHWKDKVKNGPPPSMITQGYYSTPSPTSCWVSQQSKNIESSPSLTINKESEGSPSGSEKVSEIPSGNKSTRTKKAVSHMDLETDLRRPKPSTSRSAQDLDEAHSNRISEIHDDIASDESDLYLTAAKEEGLYQHSSVTSSLGLNSTRKSRAKHFSLPLNDSLDPRITVKDDYNYERASNIKNRTRTIINENASDFKQNIGDKTITKDQVNRINTYRNQLSSIPSTPRDSSRELSPDTSSFSTGRRVMSSHLQHGYYGGRRSSIPDSSLSIRSCTRQLKGISTPHTYHSSPLAPRPSEVHDLSDTTRQIDDTESTDSTTAQSTVWDELDDLKSRIHRLEFSGKPPNNSAMGTSRSSNERPLTANTTVTTMSTSPKRDRANSKSSTDQNSRLPVSDASHILRSALIKSKPFLDPEVYRALDATTSDAITLTMMLNYSSQPDPKLNSQLSSATSIAFSERQACRRAESMCRSLTELCLAMSERKLGNGNLNPVTGHRENCNRSVPESQSRASSRSGHRVLSHLEARRSSLLATGITPLQVQPGSGGSTVSSPISRRTSLLFRSSRQRAEVTDEDYELKTRTPSRVFSEINSVRDPSHDKSHTYSFSNKSSPVKNNSLLSHRRHHVSASFSLSSVPTPSGLTGWRSTERGTPERERERALTTMIGKGTEDGADRRSSLARSLIVESSGIRNNRNRHFSTTDHTSAGQGMRYY